MIADSKPKHLPLVCAAALVLAMVGSMSPEDAPADTDREIHVTIQPDLLTIGQGEQTLMRYRYAGAPYKQYVRELPTPGGVSVLRDAPHDHLHHHALMFAVKVDGVNFWEEAGAPGRQVHRALDDVRTVKEQAGALAAFSERVDWVAPDGNLLLRERRTIRIHADAEIDETSTTTLTWRTRLEPTGKSGVTITGTHYHGLGMRFAESMDNTGTFLNAAGTPGEVFRGDERLISAKWCAYTADADGKPVTVMMYDHPNNIRPVTWFTMRSPFAYLSATLKYHEQPLEINPDQPLELCYGVAVCDGHIDATRIEKLYREWLTLQTSEPTPVILPPGDQGDSQP